MKYLCNVISSCDSKAEFFAQETFLITVKKRYAA